MQDLETKTWTFDQGQMQWFFIAAVAAAFYLLGMTEGKLNV